MTPTIDHARRVAERVAAESIAHVERFATGSGNWVYDVTGVSGKKLVVRFCHSAETCAAAVAWSNTLRPRGVPLPEILAHHITGDPSDLPWLALERIPGSDLALCYKSLDRPQLAAILEQVLQAQRVTHKLPLGNGFGYTVDPARAPHRSWADVLRAGFDRSRARIEAVGVVPWTRVSALVPMLGRFEPYFATVASTAFLDDTTTKNVLVDDNGEFRGIVDVDCICYGDPLLTAALTRMALLSMSADTWYADLWVDRVDATIEQRRAVDYYTAWFCVDFLSELGQRFNRDSVSAVDPAEVERLLGIFDALVRRIV